MGGIYAGSAITIAADAAMDSFFLAVLTRRANPRLKGWIIFSIFRPRLSRDKKALSLLGRL